MPKAPLRTAQDQSRPTHTTPLLNEEDEDSDYPMDFEGGQLDPSHTQSAAQKKNNTGRGGGVGGKKEGKGESKPALWSLEANRERSLARVEAEERRKREEAERDDGGWGT
jgi:hypothetical protein